MSTIKPVLTVLDTFCISWYLSALKISEEEMNYPDECKKRAREGADGFIKFRAKYFSGLSSARKIYAWVLYNNDVNVKIARKLSIW